MHRVVPLALRAFQLLIALTILALAVTLIKDQVYGSSPVTTRYATFTGGFGILVSLVGAIALFATFIPELVPVALDGLAALFFLAGGIAWAVGLRGVDSCNDGKNMVLNDLLNEGTLDTGEGTAVGIVSPNDDDDSLMGKLRPRCQRAMADEVLQFISFALALALVGVGYLQMRRGRSYGGGYV